MIGILRIARSNAKRNVAERFSMNEEAEERAADDDGHEPPPRDDELGNGHHDQRRAPAASAPKLANTFLNDGITQTMMIHMTTMATVMTEIG